MSAAHVHDGDCKICYWPCEDSNCDKPQVFVCPNHKEPTTSSPKKGEFPDKSVNGCKCPCHAEIAQDGAGYPCGYDECAPCHVEPPRFRG